MYMSILINIVPISIILGLLLLLWKQNYLMAYNKLNSTQILILNATILQMFENQINIKDQTRKIYISELTIKDLFLTLIPLYLF